MLEVTGGQWMLQTPSRSRWPLHLILSPVYFSRETFSKSLFPKASVLRGKEHGVRAPCSVSWWVAGQALCLLETGFLSSHSLITRFVFVLSAL